MKSKEELNNLKKEVESLNKKLSELTDEEVKEVIGGKATDYAPYIITPYSYVKKMNQEGIPYTLGLEPRDIFVCKNCGHHVGSGLKDKECPKCGMKGTFVPIDEKNG